MKKALYLILAGVAIGLLAAPAKGSETWQKIKDRFDDLKNDGLDHVNDIIANGQAKVSQVKRDAGKLAGDFWLTKITKNKKSPLSGFPTYLIYFGSV